METMMKKLFVIFLMLFTSNVYADRIEKLSKQELCETWTETAMYGSAQYLRGAERTIQHIKREELMELIEHGKGHDKLYILDNNYTDNEKNFLISGTLFGYDKMKAWVGQYGDKDLPEPEKWEATIHEYCLSTK